MRKNVFIGLLLIANFLFSQSIDYDKVISELRQKEKQECVKNPINCSAFSSQIQATIIELENRRDAEKNNYSNQLQKQEASNTINKLNQPQINYFCYSFVIVLVIDCKGKHNVKTDHEISRIKQSFTLFKNDLKPINRGLSSDNFFLK